MRCVICRRQADLQAVMDEGWSPEYDDGVQMRSGPVCPECEHLHFTADDDGQPVVQRVAKCDPKRVWRLP